MKTTPAELDQRVTEFYNVSGDTREKAVRFFLSVLAYLEIPVSSLFKAKSAGAGNGGASRRRRPRPRQERVDGTEPDEEDGGDEEEPVGESRSVTLKSGGTLTLSASTKFLALSSADRKFVFDLIDQLESYETQGDVSK
jgi:hypothetical protein